MNILLTNDDGIEAEGINSVYNTLSPHFDVYLIAPESQQSACSNAITVRSNLNIKKITDRKYSVSGFPSDCVIIGLSGDLIPDVDLIISGINHGPNVGDDLIFSGTVAAARTAYIFDKAAIAVSINSFHRASRYLDDASKFLLDFINGLMPKIIGATAAAPGEVFSYYQDRPFYNINYPDLPPASISGTKYTHVGRRIYKDSFQTANFNGGEATLQMGGYIESVHADGSDTTELEKGYISITPLKIDSTDYAILKKMSGI